MPPHKNTPINYSRFTCCQILALLIAFGACYPVSISGSANAADQMNWELSPYRIQIHLAIDDSQKPQHKLGEQLAVQLRQQVRATLYPLWKTKIQLADEAEKLAILTQLEKLDTLYQDQELEALTVGNDKHIFLSIVGTPLGTALKCREFDCTTRRWGQIQFRQLRQGWMLPTQCFELICDTFSPLAIIRSIPNDEKQILLHFRGSELPTQVDLSFLTPLGEAYQPLVVRTRSSGEFKQNSIREIHWTYLSLTGREENDWYGAIHSGIRRPFGVRRRGRIEHLAIAVRQPTGKTTVRFHSRHDNTRGLSGYEVFRRDPLATESRFLGLTNPKGSLEIPTGESQVTLLFLRSEGLLLAKLPIVPGAKPFVEIPIADDTSRLRAQAALTAITEQLVDTVAQRNILIARVHDRLKHDKIDEAQMLFTVLDNLDGLTHFDSAILSAKEDELNQSSDPKVQARIDKLFDDKRKLLGRFLKQKSISDVQNELTKARQTKAKD